MSVDAGRKLLVQVSFTERQIKWLDAEAAKRAKPGDKPNRSGLVREIVREKIDAAKGAGA